MKKQEFMQKLETNLSPLNEFQRRDVLYEYSRFINEKIDLGYREENVIEGFGNVDDLSLKILKSFGIHSLPERTIPPVSPTPLNRNRSVNSQKSKTKLIVVGIILFVMFVIGIIAVAGVIAFSIVEDGPASESYEVYPIDESVKTIEINQYSDDVYYYCDPDLNDYEIAFEGDNLDIDYYDMDGSMIFWVITDSDTLTVTYGEGLEGKIEGIEYDYY